MILMCAVPRDGAGNGLTGADALRRRGGGGAPKAKAGEMRSRERSPFFMCTKASSNPAGVNSAARTGEISARACSTRGASLPAFRCFCGVVPLAACGTVVIR